MPRIHKRLMGMMKAKLLVSFASGGLCAKTARVRHTHRMHGRIQGLYRPYDTDAIAELGDPTCLHVMKACSSQELGGILSIKRPVNCEPKRCLAISGNPLPLAPHGMP